MFLLQEILQATQGRFLQSGTRPSLKIKGVSIDSRTIQSGDLFIAIEGERFDGHDFIAEVIKKKAACVVISDKKRNSFKFISSEIPVILVPDTTQSLGHIAYSYRCRFSIPIIAITGSTGKTTTKEMIASILEAGYDVLKNIATENNHIGVPLTLLKLKPQHTIAVIEFGTNRFGDIRWLSQITAPTVGIFTNIGESHLEFLKNPLGVFKEKSELIKYLREPYTIILNSDDQHLIKLLDQISNGKIVTYGVDSKADFRASSLELKNNARFCFKVNKRHSLQLNSPALHNVYNALAAVACGRLFGISFEEIEESISNLNFPKGRQMINQSGRFVVIDDTYNANPISVRSALTTLINMNTSGRKIFVCADMLELGTKARQLHSSIGNLVGKTSVDAIFTVGPLAKLISMAAKKENKNLVSDHFATIDGIHSRLREYCQMGDVILIKGSRGMRMERTVEFVTKELTI